MIMTVNETEAASVGSAEYYQLRWNECTAKVKWIDTGLAQWNGGAATPDGGGTGSVDDPYLVDTPVSYTHLDGYKRQILC